MITGQMLSDLGLHCLPRPICAKNLGSLRQLNFYTKVVYRTRKESLIYH